MTRRSLPLLFSLFLLASPALRAEEPQAPIGAKIADLSFKDIRYLSRSLSEFKQAKAFVLVFTNTSCPVARRYFPTLRRLDKDYRDRGVQFLAVNAGEEDTITAMAEQAVEYEVEFPFVKDAPCTCVQALGVRRTPEVVVLDADRRLRYRGRIDDQYRPGGGREAPMRNDLKEAIDDVLAGRDVAVAETPVDGCLITLPEARKPETPPTYTEQVGPILRKNCAECHRPNTTAPFSLTDYESARTKAKMIAEVVTEGRMPPWFAAPGHGEFSNKRGLSADERETVLQWVASGAPRGKGDEPPAPPDDAGKWRIGDPDLTLQTQVFELPADGDVPYQYTILPQVFLTETWVQGIQILPDNPAVVHHCNLAFASIGAGFSENNFLTGFVPGGEPMHLDDGVACRIPAGSVLGLQIHFVTTGKPEKCRLSVGLRYPRTAVQKRLRFALLEDTRFAIPPSDGAFPITAGRTLDEDAIGVGLFTHMHLRGKAMTFRAVPPGADPETLLMIPNYSFQWQMAYHFPPGKARWTKGTRLECTALYDNSPFNPYNPDPKKTVRHGPQTWQEMMNGFVFYVGADEKLNLDIDPKTGTIRDADEASVVKAIQDAGGTVVVDDKLPDKPVVTVILWGPGFKVEMLKDLKEFKSLQRLRIGGPWITDDGLKPLKELKSLQKLEVRSPHVTDAGLKEIQDALPDCKIRRASPGDDK